MRRVLYIAALAALGLAAVIAVAAVGVLYTPPGRHLVAALIEPQIGEVLGGKAHVGSLKGSLPDHVTLNDIEIAGDDGVWLRVDRIDIDWAAFALLQNKIRVRSLAIDGVHVLKTPPEKSARESKSFVLPSLPTSLPDIAVDKLTIGGVDVAEPVFGRTLQLDASGRLVTHGRFLSLDLNASSAGDTDIVNASIDLNPAADHAAVDLTVASTKDGFLSSISGLGGKLYLRATGDAPLANFKMRFEAALGAYGSANLTLAGDLREEKSGGVDARGEVVLGDKLAGLSKTLGERLQIEAALTQPNGVTRLAIDKFESAAGSLSGTLSWDSRRVGAQSLAGDLSAAFAAGFMEDVQSILGESARLKFKLAGAGKTYVLDANLDAPKAGMTIERASTDLNSGLSGLVSVTLKPNEARPAPLRAGLKTDAVADIKVDGVSTLEDLHAETPNGLDFDGEARFDAAKEAIAFGGEATIAPGALEAIVPSLSLKEPAKAKISASGTLDRLSGEIDIDAPAVAAKGGLLPPSTTSLRFTRSPEALDLDISGRAKNSPGALKARLSLKGDEISVPSIALSGGGFTLNGSARYDSARQAAAIDLSYRGEDGAKPWPGMTVSGGLVVKGTLDRRGASDLDLTADNLVFGDVQARSFKAHAAGPSNVVRVEASGEGLALPAIGAIDTLGAAGAVDLSEPISLKLAKLNALASGEKITLTRPATLRFEDGITVDGFAASLGGGGSAALSAALTKTRWRGVLRLIDAPLPRGDGFASLELDLDTDRSAMARGKISLRTSRAKSAGAAISGTLSWNGDNLHFVSDRNSGGADIDIALPLKLTRTS
ncbi:MAG TPA: hypothetical protein VNH64_10035, partial [Parvularculaceae bacterium]|nr:hypothetical protein [Parvularculaceae bacterium]